MVINGNVDGFRVLDNYVHHCDNIGIDAIGFENVAPTLALDQARNGLIAGNRVEYIATIGNPSYGGESAAGGIYVDGGRAIVIERNRVAFCDIGIEVASEHKGRASSGIVVRSNLIRQNLMAGLFIGGYNKNSTGDVDDCHILHNTFYNNDTLASGDEYGQIYIQYRVTNTVFGANILYHDIKKSGQYNLFIVQWNKTGGNNSFDRNVFYGPDTPVWLISNQWIEGFSAYQARAISGIHEQFTDPFFTSIENLDFSLNAGSPAINTGEVLAVNLGTRDLLGHERTADGIPDAGAVEYMSSPPRGGTLHIDLNGDGFGLVLSGFIPTDAFYTVQASPNLLEWRTLAGYDALRSNFGDFVLPLPDRGAEKSHFYRITYN